MDTNNKNSKENDKEEELNDLIKKISSDQKIRKTVARENHRLFFGIYLDRHIKYPTAEFQKSIFHITEDQNIRSALIVAFRDSAKSTICTLSYPLWAVLGKQEKKFVVILSQTQRQARQHLVNIKRELEENELLSKDLGPFEEQKDEWGSYSLVIKNYGARIMAASSEQSIRGLKHGPYRPDLIIADDVEDLSSVKTREGRDRAYQWFTGDVLPAGDKETKMIVVGNLLHEDSLLMRLRQDMEEGRLEGVFKRYPLIDDGGNILWPGKFPTQEDIEKLKKGVGSESAWQREFLLRIVPDDEQLVHNDWIAYYDDLPTKWDYTGIGVDLAISENQSADFTAMVAGKVIEPKDICPIVYILPHSINDRLNFPKTVETAKMLSKSLGGDRLAYLFVEDVGYQKAFIQEMRHLGFPVEGVQVYGRDKHARLASITHLIKSKQILFPRKGAEKLIQQLIHFGVEKHDDLVDAFTTLVRKALENCQDEPGILKYMREEVEQMKKNPNSPGSLMGWRRWADNQ